MPHSNRYHWSFTLALFPALLLGADFGERFAEIRDKATSSQLHAFLYALPKGGDLHHHGGLSFLAEDMLAIALQEKQQHGYRFYTRTSFHICDDNENGPILIYSHLNGPGFDSLSLCRKQDYTPLEELSAAQRQAWLSAMKLDEPGENMNEFFEEIVNRLTPLFRDPYFFAEGFALNAKRFRAEGLRYIEAQWSPLGMESPDGKRLAPNQAIAILKARMAQPDVAQLGLDYRFQTTIIRFRDDLEQQIAAQFAFVDQHRDLWVGINAAGREDNDRGFALRMLNGMREARRNYSGIHLSLHAGEKVSPGHEVRDTLLLGAERIGHGINLIQDPETMLLMRNGRNLVEINLVSNKLLNYVPDLRLHPFAEYLRFGIPVCLNTDDRGSWDSNMTDEYVHAVSLFRLSWEEVKQLGRNSLEYSFAPAALKQRMLASYESDLAAFELRFAAGDWAAELKKVAAEPSGYARRNR